MKIDLDSYIDGLILSDGYLQHGRQTSSIYEQSCKHREWLEKIQLDFLLNGITSKIDNGRINTTRNTKVYRLITKSYYYLLNIRKRWYKWNELDGDGRYIKTVPDDIKLTPECVANWYLGDGTYAYKQQIELATHGFGLDEVKLLVNKLSDINIESKVRENRYYTIILYKEKNIKKMLNYIKEYRVNCYDYKFKGVI